MVPTPGVGTATNVVAWLRLVGFADREASAGGAYRGSDGTAHADRPGRPDLDGGADRSRWPHHPALLPGPQAGHARHRSCFTRPRRRGRAAAVVPDDAPVHAVRRY